MVEKSKGNEIIRIEIRKNKENTINFLKEIDDD